MQLRPAILASAILVLISASAFAQGEQITMSAPIVQATIDKYSPLVLSIKVASPLFDNHPTIDVVIVAPDGSKLSFHYPDPSVVSFDTDAEVTTLINQLNTANLSTTSLWKRVFQRLCTDFPLKFPGGCSVP